MSYIGVSTSGELLFSTSDEYRFAYGQLAGDALGLIHDVTVSGLVGYPIQAAAPASGDILEFDGIEWNFTPSPTGGAAHNLLSSTHEDTVASTATQGGIIVGNSTPDWEQVLLGLNGEVLFSNGTDLTYTILGASTPFDQGAIGAPSVAFSGDPDTGLSWGGADVVHMNAGATMLVQIDGGSGNILLNGGQVVDVRTTAVGITATAADYIINCTANNIDITLPASPVIGEVHVIKDAGGNVTGPSNSIDILGNGNTIDGDTSVSIRNSYGSFTVYWDGSEWSII